MTTSHAPLYRRAALLIVAGCVLLAMLDLRSDTFELLLLGCLIGTLFGQTTVAAFWTVFGPPAYYRRLLLSLVWVGPFACLAANKYGVYARFAFQLIAIVLGCQLIAAQALWWLLARRCRLRLQLQEQAVHSPARLPQFGIRQLMLFTTLVAVALGGLRLIVGSGRPDLLGREEWGLVLLSFVAISISLALGLISLSPGRAWIRGLLTLIVVALASPTASKIVQAVLYPDDPRMLHVLIWTNAFTSAWVLAFAAVARRSGYRLTASAPSPTQR